MFNGFALMIISDCCGWLIGTGLLVLSAPIGFWLGRRGGGLTDTGGEDFSSGGSDSGNGGGLGLGSSLNAWVCLGGGLIAGFGGKAGLGVLSKETWKDKTFYCNPLRNLTWYNVIFWSTN